MTGIIQNGSNSVRRCLLASIKQAKLQVGLIGLLSLTAQGLTGAFFF
jgi:hypothetical protein